jgi:PAS domain S-box-containing protein
VKTERNYHPLEIALHHSIEYAPMGIAIFDQDMHYLAVSRKWLEDYNLTKDIIGRSHYEIFPDTPQHWKQIHQQCLAGGIIQRDEDPYPRADGSVEWVSSSIRAWHLASGEIGGIIIYIQKITQSKQTEISLRHSEQRYRSLTHATSQIVWIVAPDGMTTNDLPSWREFTGQTLDEILGWGWMQAIHPDDRSLTAEVWGTAVKNGSIYEVEHRLRRHDGEYRYMLARGIPVLEADGSIREWVGTHTDIHHRKEIETALRESNTLLRSILESTPDFIVVKDCQGRHVALNSNLANFMGLPIEEIIGKDDIEILPPDIGREIMAKDRQIIATGKAETFEEDFSIGKITGTFLTSKAPWRDTQGNIIGLIGITRDITERKQAELAIAQAKEAAEAASHAKSEFLANMSHELRTPLNGILGYAQILQRSKHLQEEERSRIDVIYQCGSHLLTLINDILDLSKIEAQKVELMTSDFHFPAFLQGVAEMCRIRAELKGIQFRYQLANELPVGIRADEKRLRQVLINLLSNAIKFTDAGSVTFTISYASQGKIRFEVRDSGIGIPQEKLQAIFQPFEQAGDRRRQTEGTGLGLAISQRIVELMDSTIQVQSEIGVGSIFWFEASLPEAEEWVKTSQADDYGQIIGIKDRKPKILVVDDKWENRSVINNLLTPIGFEVAEAINGKEGWQQVLEFQPDLVLTDLIMPELDGFELIKQIRQSEASKHIIIIVSSASVFESDQHRSIEAGGNDFLPKPVQAIALFQKLRQHLNLEWLYEEQKPDKQLLLDHPQLVLPPQAELETLYELVMKGNFKGIIKQAALISQIDQKYIPFAKQLHQLAKQFQDQEILALIHPHQ